MSSERETVASFWHGGPLSSFERLSLTSFVRAGYRVALYAYRELGVPEVVELRDARDVLPESSLFANVDRPASFALFSNWFRYRLMSATGCTWIDTDSVLIGPRLPDSPYLFGWEDDQQINGAFLRFPRGSELQRRLLDAAQVLEDPVERDVPWGTFGPKLLTRTVEDLGLSAHALEVSALYPVHYSDAWRLFDPRSLRWCRERAEGAVALHLWNSAFAGRDIKASTPPKGSFIGELMDRHGIEPVGPEMDAAWVRGGWGGRKGRILRGVRHRVSRLRPTVIARMNATKGSPVV
jgi:hypothetical protein